MKWTFYRNITTALGLQYKCTDLAQGFPNFLLPDYVLGVLREVQLAGGYELQQYTRDIVSTLLYLKTKEI